MIEWIYGKSVKNALSFKNICPYSSVLDKYNKDINTMSRESYTRNMKPIFPSLSKDVHVKKMHDV